MSSDNVSESNTLLPESNEEKSTEKWWNNNVLDLQEAKDQTLFSLPMIITNVSYFLILLVSVMFAGHLGELELAASALANSWANVSGFCFLVGLSGALETLCGQAYGAKLYTLMGVYLQANCIISFVLCIPISISWWYSDTILISLHQDPNVSNLAGVYLRYLIPGLFGYGFLHNILRFLQTQSVVIPLVVCSMAPLIVHICLAYALIQWTSLGFKGAAIAISFSMWISVLMLGIYVLRSKEFEHTWCGFSSKSFHHLSTNFELGLPSAGMVCLEYWAFEVLVLLAGLMPNSKITTSVIGMCVNTEDIVYMFAYGLSAAASTRVSNELGAGNISRAKRAMLVTLVLSILLALFVDFALVFCHTMWAGFFSSSSAIIDSYTSILPFFALSILFDIFQGVLSGVARGVGWQHLVIYVNLAAFYLIGMPIAVVLAFKFKLYVKGLWIGLVCGLFFQSGSLLLLTLRTKWTRLNFSTNKSEEIQVWLELQKARDLDKCSTP